MGSHSGSKHDLFDVCTLLLRKMQQPALSISERQALEFYQDELKVLCKCTVEGSMPDKTETFAELKDRNHMILQAVQHIRTSLPEEHAKERARQRGTVVQSHHSPPSRKNVISVDFRARRRQPE